MNITAPTGTLYVSSFPYSAPITFTIQHGPSTDSPSTTNELKNINVLDVLVNGTSQFGQAIGNPFGNNNQCSSQMVPPAVSNCSVTDANNATVTVPFSIPGPGSYLLVVSVKHQNEIGSDQESVQVFVVNAEYPAPPAVANAYINGTAGLKAGSAKIRGCVLNEIAREHGQNNKYGPNGGPYDQALIHSDVFNFWTGTCGAPWPKGVAHP